MTKVQRPRNSGHRAGSGRTASCGEKGTRRLLGEYDHTSSQALIAARAAARSSSAPRRSTTRAAGAGVHAPAARGVDEETDTTHGMVRPRDGSNCGGHLGHAFPTDRPRPARATASIRGTQLEENSGEEGTFGPGCFWGVEAAFRQLGGE